MTKQPRKTRADAATEAKPKSKTKAKKTKTAEKPSKTAAGARKEGRTKEPVEWTIVDGRFEARLRALAAPGGRLEAALAPAAGVFSSSPCIAIETKFDILCEGDSWCCLAIYPGHVTMVQHLSSLGYSICNVAKYSRTMDDLQARKHAPTGYITKLALKPKAFMVSSGGVAFLGEAVLSWLRQRAAGDHDPANAFRYIDEEQFGPMLDSVKYGYLRIISDIKSSSIFSRTRLIFHSYGYANPTHEQGPFLGKFFLQKGFEPTNPDHRPLIKAIMKILIDRFHALLLKLRDDNPGMIDVVDFRKVLKANDFRDEIHPKPSCAEKMAQQYIPVFESLGIRPR